MQETMLQKMFDSRLPSGYGGHFYGVYTAEVVDIADPEGQGRVRVKLPWSADGYGEEYQAWARVATMMAGADRGTWFIPHEGDEVLVAFNAGDTRHPYVIGSLWNGQDSPPETMDSAGNNYAKTIRSKNGVRVSLNDKDGQESLTLETPGGQRLVLKDGPGAVEIEDSNGNSIKFATTSITVEAALTVTLNCTIAEIKASYMTVDCPFTSFSGVVQADTVLTNSVVSASYTPGAGNIW
ncbi:MAG: hypothetical protein ACI9Y1_000098 [Lentisphaeria bacterium]|jgi:uncharacterized protein involved in type VI secretion and phage assembly